MKKEREEERAIKERERKKTETRGEESRDEYVCVRVFWKGEAPFEL